MVAHGVSEGNPNLRVGTYLQAHRAWAALFEHLLHHRDGASLRYRRAATRRVSARSALIWGVDHEPSAAGTDSCDAGPRAHFLATVVSVQDPSNLNRVQVRVYDVDGITDQDGAVWARVAVPFAGNNRGAFFIPDVGDEVLVVYLCGRPALSGRDRRAMERCRTRRRTRSAARATASIAGRSPAKPARRSPSSKTRPARPFSSQLRANSREDDRFRRLDRIHRRESDFGHDRQQGVTINAPTAQVQVTAASSMSVTAPQLNVNAAMATFSGIVQCQVMQATTVVGTTYTPGAGNVW